MKRLRLKIARATTHNLWKAVASFSGNSASLVLLFWLLFGAPPLEGARLIAVAAAASAVATVFIWPWRGRQEILAAVVVGIYTHPLFALCFADLRTDSPVSLIVDLSHASVELGFWGGLPIVALNMYTAKRLCRAEAEGSSTQQKPG